MQTDSTKEMGWLNGRLVYNCFDKDNNKRGVLGYYPSGKLCFSYPLANGKFHGICKVWFEIGNIQLEEHYDNGILRLNQEWYENGALRALITPTEVVSYHENGALSNRYTMRDGRRHGEYAEWYSDGKLKTQIYYNNGLMDGLRQDWYSNGLLKAQATYRMGKLHGVLKNWFYNGNLESVVNYAVDMRQGLARQWHDTGAIKLEASYRNNVLHGIRREYDRDGKLERESVFVRFVKVEDELKERILKDQLAAKYITKIRSAVIRRFCLEHFGYARFLAESKYEVIDKDEDRELVCINWHRREESLYLIKVRCPSTGTFYTLRVPPHMKTVKEAVAWTFGTRAEGYQPQIET